MSGKVSNAIGGALTCSIIAMVILAIAGIDGGLDNTSPWMYYTIGCCIATIGSILGGNE